MHDYVENINRTTRFPQGRRYCRKVINMHHFRWSTLLSIAILTLTLTTYVPGAVAQEDADAEILASSKPTPADNGASETETQSEKLKPVNLDSEPIDLIVEDPEPPQKKVLISLADQGMWIFEGDNIIQQFDVSTGVPAHRTPTGSFQVWNKAPSAYSNRYECWMLQWMAITRDGLFGMHSLQGTSYLRRIGSVASHGCIRLRHEDADWLYGWTEIGTPVEIVDDWEEPEEETSEEIGSGGDLIAENFYYW